MKLKGAQIEHVVPKVFPVGTAALSHAAFRVGTVFYTALRRCATGLATLVSLNWSNYRRLPQDIGRIQGDRLTATG